MKRAPMERPVALGRSLMFEAFGFSIKNVNELKG